MDTVLACVEPTSVASSAPSADPPAFTAGAGRPKLEVEHLSVDLAGTRVVDGVSLSVRAGEVLCILGPSGCGKSTTLRAIAGLVRADAGRIRIDGAEVSGSRVHKAPEARRVGLVFQDNALFPHLTVLQNVQFGLASLSKAEQDQRARDTLKLVGLASFADRFPADLSGGEQQRVALARAIAPRPLIMLMDEPFSGLDGRLREQVRDEALAILKDLRAATLLVTHDPEEAMRLGDRVALMRRGRIAQIDTPANLYYRPVDVEAAAVFSCVNRFFGTVRNGCVDTPLGLVPATSYADGDAVEVVLRPHAVTLRKGNGACDANATVLRARVLGEEMNVETRLFEGRGYVCVRFSGVMALEPGEMVCLRANPDRTLVFPDDGTSPGREALLC